MANLNHAARSVLITLVVISTYSSTIVGAVAQNKQTITFYENVNCLGQNFTFEDSNFDLFKHWVTNSTSYYVHGMWEVHMQSTVEPDPPVTAVTYLVLHHSTGLCQRTHANTTVVRVERFGPSLLDTPEITFFGDRSLRGIRIPANKTDFSFTRPIMTQSFMFTGVHEWTIFEDVNFEGKSLCLKATDEVKKAGYGFTYNWEESILMGSIKYGCDSGSNSQTNVRSNIMMITSIPLAFLCLIMKM